MSILARTMSPGSEWVEREVAEMVAAWERGEQTTADEVLARSPGLDDEVAVRLIYEEVCLRRDAGQDVATIEVVRKYPRWRADLEPLLACDRLMRPQTAANFPAVGECLGEFKLLAELGRGTAGRAFLAAEPLLADRPVVLKVTARDHDEHLSLARLQHTHIVPLYSVQVFSDRGLRALCMPYLGGANLAQVLVALAEIPAERRGGRDILRALDRLAPKATTGNATGNVSVGAPGPYRQFLQQASYVQAITWIAACLADALQYAHEHGLVHMDVKPSNVLIAGDGQPMLLDFHLADSPIVPGGEPTHRLGGTPGWTAPEQDAAMSAVRAGEALTVAVDGRADLYSLGLLIVEALGGPVGPAPREGRPRLDACNSKVSTGLADIVAKCLEPDPVGRYLTASALADDLRRHLNDQPLRGVPNRSLRERWWKWRRRRPDALTRGSARLIALAAVVALAGLCWTGYRHQIGEIDLTLREAKRQRIEGHYGEAILSAQRGLEMATQIRVAGVLPTNLARELRLAKRGESVKDLQALADRIRFCYGTSPVVNDEMRELAPKLRMLWDGRKALLLTSAEESLDAETERRLEVDLLEVAVVWADLRVRLASPDDLTEARHDALAVLDEAENSFGPSPALARERQALAHALGLPAVTPADTPAPSSAWEHYDLGRSYLRSGQIAAAAEEFRQTLSLRPQDFWPNFYQGACDYRLGRPAEALAAFRACVTLSPKSAEARVNRAHAYERLRRDDEALRDYDRAIELDSHLAEAYLNRGLLYLRAGRQANAITDLRRALTCSSDRATSGLIHYNLSIALLASGDRSSADAEALLALSLGAPDARSRKGVARVH